MNKMLEILLAILMLTSLAIAADVNVTIDTDKEIYNQGEIVQFTIYNHDLNTVEIDFKPSVLDNTGKCVWGCIWAAIYDPITIPSGGSYSWTWDQTGENGQVDPGYYKGELCGYYSNEFEIAKANTTNGGSVWTWGSNGAGELGDGTTITRLTPVQINGLSDVIAIAGGEGDGYTIALKSDGTVWTWGYNGHGELGDGTTTNRLTPVQVINLSNVTAIAGGEGHTVALKSDGTVWTWGWNGAGALGDGTTTQRLSPVQVSGITNVTAIASGFDHTIAIKSDGTVWTWGGNYDGELGDGTTTNRLTPVQVNGFSNVIATAGGGGHTIILKSDGTVWTSGYNACGQLGDGTTTNRLTPVRVNGLSDIVAVASGYGHTIALKSDGTVWTWGNIGCGKMGGSIITDRLVPIQENGISNVIAIAAGYRHIIALKSDNTVWTWGYNGAGQLGDNTTIDRLTPVQVNLSNVTTIAGGNAHTIAISTATPVPIHTITKNTIGVNTHLYDWSNNLFDQYRDIIKNFGVVRDYAWWDGLEKKNLEDNWDEANWSYDWTQNTSCAKVEYKSGYDTLVEKFQDTDSPKLLVIFELNNKNFANLTDIGPQQYDIFYDYVKHVVERYDGDGIDDMPGLRNRVLYYEIGNEPEYTIYTEGVYLTPENYVKYRLIPAYMAIKDACNDCIVMNAGLGMQGNGSGGHQDNFTTEYLEEMYDNITKYNIATYGVASMNNFYMDKVAIHYYHKERDFSDNIDNVTKAIEKFEEKSKPIWITEFGAKVGGDGKPIFIRDEDQAGIIIRWLNLMIAKKIEMPMFYQLKEQEYTLYKTNCEGSTEKISPRLSFLTYKVMINILNGLEFENMEIIKDAPANPPEEGNGYLYKIYYSNPENTKKVTVLWFSKDDGTYLYDSNDMADEKTTVNIPITNIVRLIDMNGTSSTPVITDNNGINEINLEVGERPIYLISTIAWEFNTAGDKEGWELHNIGAWSVEKDGIFRIDPDPGDYWIESQQLSINANSYDTIEINMASNGPDGIGTIYFRTSDSGWYAEDKKVLFDVINDGEFRNYSVFLGINVKWNGTITGIRIDPSNDGTIDNKDIGFEYIRFINTSVPDS